MDFTEGQLTQLRAMLREELAAPTVTDRILTFEEARAYSKYESNSAFYRWCRRLHVTSVGPGRYARSQLDTALEREASKRRAAKAAPRRPDQLPHAA